MSDTTEAGGTGPDGAVLRLGLDVGSTTVKAVVLDGDRTVFEEYRRHNADVRGELARLLREVSAALPGRSVRAAVTGSGGLSVADLMGVPFVQEVIAETATIRRHDPDTDVVIELGGEDAKITYLHPTPEQRMNGSCAGGTGAFIDQMASLLHTDAAGLDALAAGATHIYPIASRCGVFAKSDIQPLINQGAAPEDLAASVFRAVATQTVSGLACGRPIRGTVVFLGGPLHFLPQLREAYAAVLPADSCTFRTPERAQLYVAIGAALLADGHPEPLETLAARLRQRTLIPLETRRMRALFADADELRAFEERHARATVPQRDIEDAAGDCFLGIDAGSTTIKAVVTTADDEIVFSHYASNQGDPVSAAVAILRRIHDELPPAARIVRSCVTGYGEDLVRAALHLDEGEIETMAHYRAAEHLSPGVTAVIDIGGQDMKYLRIRDHVVDSIAVNEACSSGCGSFLQTFAQTMGADVRHFAQAALEADHPADLGSRCTVFMNSSVKQAQKEGASMGDISAGLSYSVVRNALYKVIKLKDPSELGDTVVVQGGTFLNDAVLRAFELLTGREVVRPDIAGLMGAYGAALTARRHRDRPGAGGLPSVEELEDFRIRTELRACRLCQNHCDLTISHLPDGTRHVSGNRCERGASAEARPRRSPIPNLIDYRYRRTFGYRRLTEKAATRGDIGIPRVLNMYENYPFWFTLLTRLGFRVTLSGRSSHALYERGMESIASENICYPAKLVHGHIQDLLAKGQRTIFYPCVTYEQQLVEGTDNTYNCPIVGSYAEVIANTMEELREPGVRFLKPFVNLGDRDTLVRRVVEEFADWQVGAEEAALAVDEAYAEAARVREDVRAEGRRALAYLEEHDLRGIVLAGRPYHADPEINHGIPELIVGLGMVVLTEDAICDQGRLERPLRVRDQWAYHSRLYEAADVVARNPRLEIVQLNSFGCGLDAVTTDQVAEIIEAKAGIYTTLKIDEVSNLGAARIRLRSLKAATEERTLAALAADDPEVSTMPGASGPDAAGPDAAEPVAADPAAGSRDIVGTASSELVPEGSHVLERHPFTKEMKERRTILVPQMSPIHFRLVIPVLERSGYRAVLLDHASKEDIEVGLAHVNNDACYPAIMVVGQLVNAFVSGRYDPDGCVVGITQTGGMCRATNYAGLLRKALRDAGYGSVPVLAVSPQSIEENPGFRLSVPMMHRAVKALVIGDVLQQVLLRVRPYERESGSADALYRRWNTIAEEHLRQSGYCPTLGRRLGFGRLIREIVAAFDALPLHDVVRRPRVGIVGEILVKFHPDANNHAVRVVESEGCEAVLPGLMEFFLMGLAGADWTAETLGVGEKNLRTKHWALWALEQYQQTAHRALATSQRFEVPARIGDLAEKAQTVLSLGNRAGEAWLLTAEMIELIETGTPNIICAQPFACLPNHIVGRGMFHELRRRYPQANIVSIDYDPGASEVNQLNRIKLMISTAKLVDEAVPEADPTGARLESVGPEPESAGAEVEPPAPELDPTGHAPEPTGVGPGPTESLVDVPSR
ncbi:acyl-CoA dehydratase activase-related protein [Raineyella sp. LH-20]|uniref:acyl-CoA dehydratase activase-related protein n=1 Tax=Raineyella sp. LH-20 TaxID=3081204 RepID=UPI0029537E1E|nr:acyl-CoA dehydratase activase-related protein [Raineyella sp. LH-20]WOP19363.1 acyl-CoA dehydratase activase-related protein [Raineyella sp. LH-20]